VLTSDSWARHDVRLFDACWREATLSHLFGDGFETGRHRIQKCVAAARKKLVSPTGFQMSEQGQESSVIS
jgi:hypothetical protein